jgi:hypothetical protein
MKIFLFLLIPVLLFAQVDTTNCIYWFKSVDFDTANGIVYDAGSLYDRAVEQGTVTKDDSGFVWTTAATANRIKVPWKLDAVTSFSLFAVIKVTDVTATRMFFTCGKTTIDNYMVNLGVDTAKKLVWYLRDGGTASANFVTTAALNLDQWYVVGITFNAAGNPYYKAYVDNERVAITWAASTDTGMTIDETLSTETFLGVRSRVALDAPWQGKLENLIFYDEVISDAKRTAYYNAVKDHAIINTNVPKKIGVGISLSFFTGISPYYLRIPGTDSLAINWLGDDSQTNTLALFDYNNIFASNTYNIGTSDPTGDSHFVPAMVLVDDTVYTLWEQHDSPGMTEKYPYYSPADTVGREAYSVAGTYPSLHYYSNEDSIINISRITQKYKASIQKMSTASFPTVDRNTTIIDLTDSTWWAYTAFNVVYNGDDAYFCGIIKDGDDKFRNVYFGHVDNYGRTLYNVRDENLNSILPLNSLELDSLKIVSTSAEDTVFVKGMVYRDNHVYIAYNEKSGADDYALKIVDVNLLSNSVTIYDSGIDLNSYDDQADITYSDGYFYLAINVPEAFIDGYGYTTLFRTSSDLTSWAEYQKLSYARCKAVAFINELDFLGVLFSRKNVATSGWEVYFWYMEETEEGEQIEDNENRFKRFPGFPQFKRH